MMDLFWWYYSASQPPLSKCTLECLVSTPAHVHPTLARALGPTSKHSSGLIIWARFEALTTPVGLKRGGRRLHVSGEQQQTACPVR